MKWRLSTNKLGYGVTFYALSASADLQMTMSGSMGAPALEGNPLMRAMMVRFGPEGGLWLEKSLVGLICLVIAVVGEREMKRRAPWLDLIPSTKRMRAWVKSGDRSWTAYTPLYSAALFQLLAAGCWLWLRCTN